MMKLHIITPVKDAIELTLQTAKAVMESEINVPFQYTIYNDFSTPENTLLLERASKEIGFELINLCDITQNPSPNYLLVLQMAQERAVKENAALLIVESDVVVGKATLQTLFNEAMKQTDCGMAAAVTVDSGGVINYPYLFAKERKEGVYKEKKHLSFCCTLLSLQLLRKFDFHTLNANKHWHDVTVSHTSLKLGFSNYLLTNVPVLHQPHGSRPWKMLKYTNPLKYYWRKFFSGLDKI